MHKKYLNFVIFSLALLMFQHKSIADTDTKTMLLTHKTPTCGCCKEWVKHAKEKGFNVHTKDHQNLEDIKKMYSIKPEYRSCCLLYTSPSPRDMRRSRMPSSA